ncbi:MAG: hypothetical protein J6Y02_20915 [Pseudobutyrivibrio sp.]|nr:hypothetical protein [Pseudobutyrivibrio sp.]
MYEYEISTVGGWWKAQAELDNDKLSYESREELNTACDEYRRTHPEEF